MTSRRTFVIFTLFAIGTARKGMRADFCWALFSALRWGHVLSATWPGACHFLQQSR